jgi:ribosomal protein S18 acetylase RimI-like enzyme
VSTNDRALIRPLRDTEIAALCALSREIWRTHYPGIISAAQIEYMLAERYDETVIRDELTRDDLWWDVLMLDDRMVGYVSYFPTGAVTNIPREMKIDKLYVHPGVHRQGYGGTLVRHVAAFAAQRGCGQLMLAVNRHNKAAIAAYHKHGFHIAETSVREIGGGFVMDDYIMVKEIV